MVGGLDHLLFFHILTYNNVSEGLKPPTRYILRADPGEGTPNKDQQRAISAEIGEPMIRL